MWVSRDFLAPRKFIGSYMVPRNRRI